MLIRPVTQKDHGEILKLAQQAGIGFTSLPPDARVLEEKIANAVGSFHGKPRHEKEENFLFVLEDDERGQIVGSTGLYTHVGLSRPFYSYKLSTIVQASQEVGVYSRQQVLHMVNDYTGASELGSLFLVPDYRRDGLGRFLSRCRYLVIADFPHLFSDIVISEIRGVQNAGAESPFYNNLARHFFKMDFKKADYINATIGSQFIADLMPKYPIYVNLLPQEAQEVIGQPFEGSRPAKHMLESEGFRHEGYVDVFDAGPTMQAECREIRSVRLSANGTVRHIEKSFEGDMHMISNCTMPDYFMCRAPLYVDDYGELTIDAVTAKRLRVDVGSTVRYVA